MVLCVFGFVWDFVVIIMFGINVIIDVFWVVFRVFNFLCWLFVEGFFVIVFVLVFMEVKEICSYVELCELMVCIVGILGGVLMLVIVLVLIFVLQLVLVFFSGVDIDLVKQGLLVDLFCLIFLFLLFVLLIVLVGGVLNSFQCFVMLVLILVIFNLCMIVGVLWLVSWLGGMLEKQILVLGWVVLVVGILQLLFQLFLLKGINLLILLCWGWCYLGVCKVMMLMVLILFGFLVVQINLLLDMVIVVKLIDGLQFWLLLVDCFLELLLGVFGVVLGMVILLVLVCYYVSIDCEGFLCLLDWGLCMILLILVLVMLGLLLLVELLIVIIFQYGQFSVFDICMIVLLVYGLSFGFLVFVLLKVVLLVFYVCQDIKILVCVGVVVLVVNMVFNFVLLVVLYQVMVFDELKVQGVMVVIGRQLGLYLVLGIVSVLFSYLNLGLLWYWLGKIDVYQCWLGWGGYLLCLLLVCVVMVGVLLVLLYWLLGFLVMNVWEWIGVLVLLVGGGGVIYVVVMLVMGFCLCDLCGY